MLPAEIASTTAKPSMILARNRRVGSLSDGKLVRFSNPTPSPRLHSENPDWEPPAPDPVRKTRAEWIRVCKFRPHSPGCKAGSVFFVPGAPFGEVDGRH